MADGPVLRSKPLGGADCPPQSETEPETETAGQVLNMSDRRQLGVSMCSVFSGYAGGQPALQQDVNQSAGFVGQNAVPTGYAQMQARPQVDSKSLTASTLSFLI